MVGLAQKENERLRAQAALDAKKSAPERNRLGQFATPTALARDIVAYGKSLLHSDQPIRFLDPALGTGSFFSALLHQKDDRILDCAQGFEIDAEFACTARELWQSNGLHVEHADFTRAEAPMVDKLFNLVICNPPYVRHHHLDREQKSQLQDDTLTASGIQIKGLSGLYCYFMGLTHPWMADGAIAGWLIPSEFMDVNYGRALKKYLLDKVTLLRIHRFDPSDVQFADALVSSAVVWFKNHPPEPGHSVNFTFGGTLTSPQKSRRVCVSVLRQEAKWTRFPSSAPRGLDAAPRLRDIFRITRGVATGDNSFFILSEADARKHDLPPEFLRPILPSPRYLEADEIQACPDGSPDIEKRRYLLDCRLSEDEVRQKHPALWRYLELGKERGVHDRYLSRNRKVWYAQENRPPTPFICTYLGRSDSKSGRPFRFILNHSDAIAANVYLMLYPTKALSATLESHPESARVIWELLNSVTPDALLGEGRVYGGGLHKLEPRELANVSAERIVEALDLPLIKPRQQELFATKVA